MKFSAAEGADKRTPLPRPAGSGYWNFHRVDARAFALAPFLGMDTVGEEHEQRLARRTSERIREP